MNLIELKQQRVKLIEDQRALYKRAETDKRTALNETEQAEYDKREAELEALEKTISAREKLEAREADVRSVGSHVAHLPTQTATDDPKAVEARRMKSMDAYLRCVDTNRRLTDVELRDLQITPDTKGGYLLPHEMVNSILEGVRDTVGIRARATVFQLTNAASLGVPTLAARANDFAWGGELTNTAADTTMSFGHRELSPNFARLRVLLSKAFVRLAPSVTSFLAEQIAYLWSVNEEAAFMTGNGVDKPLGIFTASANGVPTTQDVTNASVTDNFEADKLFEALYTLKPADQANSTWIIHRAGVRRVRQLKDGFSQYLWQPGLQAGQPDQLLGRPVLQSEYAPSTFTTGLYIAAIANLKYYYIADAMNMQIQTLVELYAASNQIGYFADAWTDGMPARAESFVRIKTA